MRLLLWGLAAAALFATEPGKRLQRKAVDKFKELKGKTCGGDAQECDGQDKGANAESVNVGANGKPSKKEEKKEEKKDEKNFEQGKRKLRAVSNDETAKGAAEGNEELEESRAAIKDSNARHPEMGAEDNEDEAEEPRLEKDTEDEMADGEDDEKEDETAEADDEADDKTSEVEASGDEEEHGIDQNKAAELVEKLSAKPSAPEDELKSA
ncbi:MAG: hypothetical protein C0469_00605 [Cyanobacteria bacterium DS2.3.42]|nr:hypothetical protein [Cyanobacteria bacterium DS2.3.42]